SGSPLGSETSHARVTSAGAPPVAPRWVKLWITGGRGSVTIVVVVVGDPPPGCGPHAATTAAPASNATSPTRAARARSAVGCVPMASPTSFSTPALYRRSPVDPPG